MRKIYIVFSLIIFLFVFVFIILSVFFNKPIPPSDDKNIFPTSYLRQPTSSSKNDLYVIQSTPSDNATNIPLDSKITFFFNRSFSIDEINLAILPETEYKLNVSNNSLIISPRKLELSTIYTITIKTGSSLKLFSMGFTTIGPTPTPFDAPEGDWIKDVEEINRINEPDVFLANKTPYSNNDFSIVYGYKTTPYEHFFFTVELKRSNKEASKNGFINWLKSLKLTDQQIQNLEIIYK